MKPPMRELDVGMVTQQPTLTGAIMLCVHISGLDDRDLAKALAIDPAQWSRIKSGQAHFPQERMNRLMDICGNEAPLIWLASRRGYDLQAKLSLMEQKLATERHRADKLEEQNKLLRELVTGRGIA
ncbi:MAG: hypothetical protein IPK59_23050 [Rhodospirillaceae bacterium]|nr:hypothetical protein [Rhodospirillaceae bacterium]